MEQSPSLHFITHEYKVAKSKYWNDSNKPKLHSKGN